jgi:cellobiose epimerase
MLDETRLRAYMQRAETELCRNILPFWIQHTVDQENGGFYGKVTNDLHVDKTAPQGALLTSRILWTYSAAYRRYRNAAYLKMADWAYEDLMTRFWDREYGGLYWMVDVDGTPIKNRKQIYGQAFGIYALAETYAATGQEASLEKAQAIFQLLEQHAYDPIYKGYFEAFTRDWQIADDMSLNAGEQSEMKSMNTSIHIMEAFTNLLRVWPDETLRSRLSELIGAMMDHIISAETYHTILFFDETWAPRSENVSYGHDIETSWLLVEATEVLGDPILHERAETIAVKMAQAVYDEGVDPDGAVVYEKGPEGLEDSTKQWWPQAEAAVGFLSAYQLTGGAHFLEAAYRSWDFIDAYLVDRKFGGWIRYIERDHTIPEGISEDGAKVSFWKCPYHNGRACMELAERLHKLLTS